MKKILHFSLPLILLLAVAVISGCNEPPTLYDGDGINIGTGAVTFRFQMTDADGDVTAWNVSTDETTVGAALYAVGLVDNTAFATYVNNVRADFNLDNAFWAFYYDGVMSMVGMGVEIDPNVIYAFVFTAS